MLHVLEVVNVRCVLLVLDALHAVLCASLYSGGCAGRDPFGRGVRVMRDALCTGGPCSASCKLCSMCLEAEKDVRYVLYVL